MENVLNNIITDIDLADAYLGADTACADAVGAENFSAKLKQLHKEKNVRLRRNFRTAQREKSPLKKGRGRARRSACFFAQSNRRKVFRSLCRRACGQAETERV